MKYIYTFSLLLFFSINVISQGSLKAKLLGHYGLSDFKHANLSVAVVDIEKSALIAGLNEEKVLIPASSLKLITTLSALEILGEDYVYETNIYYSGKISSDGTLEGNIYLRGSGDPTFGTTKFKSTKSYVETFKAIAKAIKRAGITCVEGDIIVDESVFNSQPISPSWQWNDLGNYYAAGAWGVNLNENQYKVYFSGRDKIGNRPKIRICDPVVPKLRLENEVLIDSTNTGDNAYIFGGPYNYYKRIVGTIPQGKGDFVIKGSVPNPPYFAAYSLQRALKQLKIKSGELKTTHDKVNYKKKEAILKISSPSLKQIVKRANLESNNLYCESILKNLGAEKGSSGKSSVGLFVIRKYLRKLGINASSLHMEDGSGLSARNNVNSLTLAKFLQKYTQRHSVEKVKSLLAIGGGSGTMAGMFRKSPARGRVFAKSGSMSRVLSYTGLIKNKRGRWVSFSIIVNGFDVKPSKMRKNLESMMTDIYKYS